MGLLSIPSSTPGTTPPVKTLPPQAPSPKRATKKEEAIWIAFANSGQESPYEIQYNSTGKNLGAGKVISAGNKTTPAMLRFNGGVSTALSEGSAITSVQRIKFTKDAEDPEKAPEAYYGCSSIVSLTRFNNGVYAALRNCYCDGFTYCTAFSTDGSHFSPPLHKGPQPISSMIAYRAGVLTAFSNVPGTPPRFQVHFSTNVRALQSGDIRYDGTSPVIEMAVQNDGVLTAFGHADSSSDIYQVRFSPNGTSLGAGALRYEGAARVIQMMPFLDGMLTAFSVPGGLRNSYRLIYSEKLDQLDNGVVEYQGPKRITALSK